MNAVCAAAVPRAEQGVQFAWSPDSKSVASFRPTDRGFGLRLELDLFDAATGEHSVLLSEEQIDRLFPPRIFPNDVNKHPPPRAATSFKWASDSSGLLLHSDLGIVWLDRKTLQTRTLVPEKEPIFDVQLSPDGRWASFVRDHNLWVVPIAGGPPRAITKGGDATLRKGELDWLYPAELGTTHGYTWSPDSSRIAYFEFNLKDVAAYTPPFSSREETAQAIDYPTPGGKNPVVRIFVTTLKEGAAPVAIDTGAEKDIYLPRLQWLPDGKSLAIHRLNRSQNRLDLLLADAHTGATRTLLTETDSYWINLSDILYFLPGTPQFVWSSERSGYRHLYLYDLNGKLLRQLTDGQWEVTSLDAVDERARKIYFTSTQKTPLERHLYVSGFDGKEAERLPGDSGTHEAVFAPDVSAYIDSFSTATKPWTRTLYKLGETASATTGTATNRQQSPSKATTKVFVLDAPPAPTPPLRPVDFLTVKTHDGVELNAMMIRPGSFTPDKKYPAVLYLYGGPGRQAVHDAWDGDISMWQQLLAQHGYIIFAVDNRGSAGRGHLFEEPLHLRFEGQEISDQKDAVRFLQSLPYIDPARTGIWGRGFGGALAVNGMLHPPILFKAGFAVAPVVNWRRYSSAFTERYLGDPVKNQDGYLSSSPLDESQYYKGPMLVGQGTADLDVHPDQAMEFQQDLLEKQKYVELSLFPGQSHNIDKPDACAVLYQRATDFFGKNL